MNVEDLGIGLVNIEPSPPSQKVDLPSGPPPAAPPAYPDYPKELSFLPMFTDPATLGGRWDPANDELVGMTLEPQETKFAAANMRFLASQEDVPLEQFAPVSDLYQDAYNQRLFGGTADTPAKFYAAVGDNLQRQRVEEDRYDDTIVENEWPDEHPKLATALRILHALSGAVLDLGGIRPEDDPPVTKAETYEHYRRSLNRLAGLNYEAFNPASAVVQDNGKGSLEPNLDGLANLAVGFASGKSLGVFSGESRAFNIRNGIRDRVSRVSSHLNETTGIKYDPETKRFYDGNGQISEGTASERIRNEAVARGVLGRSRAFVEPAKIEAAIQRPTAAPVIVDRRVEYYNSASDVYYDRGHVIQGKDIESYLVERSQLPGEPRRIDSRIGSDFNTHFNALRAPHSGLIVALQQYEDVPVPFGTKGIRNLMSNITIVTNCEVALLRMKDGTRILRLGGPDYVVVRKDVKKIIAHTHPGGTFDFSYADVFQLMLRGQKSSVIIDPGGDIAMRLRIKDQLE